MSALTPDLFQRRFQDFMAVGRSRLASLAPEWTDHNAHDPGITLMELLAWVAEAQLYGLSRLRRDERAAYAALLEIAPTGTQGASGLLWPDTRDPSSPARTFSKSLALGTQAVVNVLDAEDPTFRPTGPLLFVPWSITKVEARLADGRRLDHTLANQRGGPAFLPLGDDPGARDVLAITFKSREALNAVRVHGAPLSIGFRVAGAAAGTPRRMGPPAERPTISARLVTASARFPLKIVADTTSGLLATGVLLLDLASVGSAALDTDFSVELWSENGFVRPPRVTSIAPNVFAVRQGYVISREAQLATGAPNWSFELAVQGLRYGAAEEPLTVEVAEAAALATWIRCDALSDCGPGDRVYELDRTTGRVTFGNDVNGRIPPAGSDVLVSYAVSDGDHGSVARNRRWKVAGFPGAFWSNLDAISGGAASADWLDQRREARRKSKNEHALISSQDIVEAAKTLPLLEVARAWIVTPGAQAPRTGVVQLVAMRDSAQEATVKVPETARWLEAVRGRLAGRMPLGTRLVVTGPRYVEFSTRIVVEASAGLVPASVQERVEQALNRRLALLPSPQAPAPREPGVPVTKRDLSAWVRATPGVQRIIDLQLFDARGESVPVIDVAGAALPRRNIELSRFEVRRPGPGGGP